MAELFTPLTLRDLTIPNRVWLAPMCQYSVLAEDGVPTDWHLVHLGSRAQGGFGLILTEATAVVPEGRISPQDTGLWDDVQRDAWKPVVDFVHGQGSAIGVQLAHAGRKASTYRGFPGEPTGSVAEDEGGWTSVGPTADAFPGYTAPRALATEELAGVVRAFAESARRADEAGFDVVEVHAAHGYLLHQFLSPLSNTRTDGYGGSFAGRTRLLLEVVDAVRDVWPAGKPVFVRISATDWTEGGWSGDDSVRLSAVLKDRGVDLVDVSTGGNVMADIPVGPGYQLPFSEAVRHQAGIPTGAVGLITSPQQAEEVLASGQADAVLLARAALREPSWPLRAAAELGLTWRDAPYPPAYSRGKWDDVLAPV
ncbi:NADH:flavin oxidoreductase/NADH oxidase [Microlunatus capsulatus]|uniref:2,4-dienoyl-CoA reductase-like NADH-dependent reductase (Old Yellow Enzyme family) n=1 Tax=Microlunatus capsulatus TaxID=99117 RepID=A0ABS4Z8F9_9ACTN|nr:NADH:flavin oxidoreductase/NADH oxidase [Microlunatus capsulatus]MBP2417337.1 2,4-dienoyl-CoA reductase-like NADH-dependent reductase (Old Yellow Enzyme family) [Microlunatus capsulatus]